MKKTICIILFAVSISSNLVGMMEDQHSRKRMIMRPNLTNIVGAQNQKGHNWSILDYNEAYIRFNSLFFTPNNNGESNRFSEQYSSDDYSEEEQGASSSIRFNLDNLNDDRESAPIFKRSLSPLPVSISRSDSYACFPDVVEKKCSSGTQKRLPRFPSSSNISKQCLFQETSYIVMDWRQFHVMLYNDREREIMSKPLSPNVIREKRVATVDLITRHADDGLREVHKKGEKCEKLYISGNDCDCFRRFRDSNQWQIYTSEDERNIRTANELFPDQIIIQNSKFNEGCVPELAGIPKGRVGKHSDCTKMLSDPKYKTPRSKESIDEIDSRFFAGLSEIGRENKNAHIFANTLTMNAIMLAFNDDRDKSLVKIGNLNSILIRTYGNYITAYTDDGGKVKIFKPNELSMISDILNIRNYVDSKE